MITGFDHVQVAMPPGQEEAARAFYASLLEMTELAKPPVLAARGGCWFTSGTAVRKPAPAQSPVHRAGDVPR
jgi:hypothetical protein